MILKIAASLVTITVFLFFLLNEMDMGGLGLILTGLSSLFFILCVIWTSA